MIDQLMDSYRKASASWLQWQQEAFRQMAQQWLNAPQNPAGAATGWSRDFQKRWLEVTVDALNRHRESLESAYNSGLQVIDQTFRVSEAEAKSSEDYRHLIEDLWRKLFDTFKAQSETQLREFQAWAEKSKAFVEAPQA